MTDVERVRESGDGIQTQCWICPKCNDDHNPGGQCSPSYEDLRKERDALKARPHSGFVAGGESFEEREEESVSEETGDNFNERWNREVEEGRE